MKLTLKKKWKYVARGPDGCSDTFELRLFTHKPISGLHNGEPEWLRVKGQWRRASSALFTPNLKPGECRRTDNPKKKVTTK